MMNQNAQKNAKTENRMSVAKLEYEKRLCLKIPLNLLLCKLVAACTCEHNQP